MADRLNWEKGNRSEKKERDRTATANNRFGLGAQLEASQHDLDVRTLQELSTAPELTDREKNRIQRSLKWLSESPTRTIWPNNPHRSGFDSMRRKITMIRDGVDWNSPESKAARARLEKVHGRRTRLRKISRDEKKAKLSSFRCDPAHLPKRPPGK